MRTRESGRLESGGLVAARLFSPARQSARDSRFSASLNASRQVSPPLGDLGNLVRDSPTACRTKGGMPGVGRGSKSWQNFCPFTVDTLLIGSTLRGLVPHARPLRGNATGRDTVSLLSSPNFRLVFPPLKAKKCGSRRFSSQNSRANRYSAAIRRYWASEPLFKNRETSGIICLSVDGVNQSWETDIFLPDWRMSERTDEEFLNEHVDSGIVVDRLCTVCSRPANSGFIFGRTIALRSSAND